MKGWIVLLVAACLVVPTFCLAGEAQKPAPGAEAAANVKRGKSNSDDRSGQPGGASNERAHVKGSKSNTSERATSVHSGKSNSSSY